jgi:hypothetical protein
VLTSKVSRLKTLGYLTVFTFMNICAGIFHKRGVSQNGIRR